MTDELAHRQAEPSAFRPLDGRVAVQKASRTKPSLTAEEAVERFFDYAQSRFEETRTGWLQGFRNQMGLGWEKLQRDAFVQDLVELYRAALVMIGLSDLYALTRVDPYISGRVSTLIERRLADDATLSSYVRDFMAHGLGTAQDGEVRDAYSGTSEAWAFSIVERVLRFLDLLHYRSAIHLRNDHALVFELKARLLGSGMVGYWGFVLHAHDIAPVIPRSGLPTGTAGKADLSIMQMALAGILGLALAIVIALFL